MKQALGIVLWIVLVGLVVPAGRTGSRQAQPAHQPTSTIKACHACGDRGSPTATRATTLTCDECALGATRASALGTVIANRPDAQHVPIARIVLFWRVGCPHCHEVINNVLPPLLERYGNQVEILMVEVASQEAADALYAAASAFAIRPENVGVPFLIIGERALIGSLDIPSELPGLIEHYLAQGGTDWPDLPELRPLLPMVTDVSALTPPRGVPATPDTGAIVEESASSVRGGDQKVDGQAMAIAVMVGAAAALLHSLSRLLHLGRRPRLRQKPGMSRSTFRLGEWVVPGLALVGLAVSVYLSYVEISLTEAVCGPIGDCNAVQSSPYARLFGVLPLGLLGAAGYTAILGAWLAARFEVDGIGWQAPTGLFWIAFVGTLFSLYLTFLEAFVIRAVCAWCLLSAVTMTLILLLSPDSLRRTYADRHLRP